MASRFLGLASVFSRMVAVVPLVAGDARDLDQVGGCPAGAEADAPDVEKLVARDVVVAGEGVPIRVPIAGTVDPRGLHTAHLLEAPVLILRSQPIAPAAVQVEEQLRVGATRGNREAEHAPARPHADVVHGIFDVLGAPRL